MRTSLNKNKGKKNKILLILSILLILGGILIILYPNISNQIARKNQTAAIRTYDTAVSSLSEEQLSNEMKRAQIYNENLAGDPVHDPFVVGSGYALPTNYLSVLNISNDEIMGHVEIPKIKVKLPIYHGTSEEVLTKGVGHIESTSLPVGGDSTHSILTGHTGLPSAELFTKLDQLGKGDIFYIHVLGEILTYKVYETKVILPNEIDELRITSGKDWVTLVTCTPYGINSHRLLVKAERVPFEEYVENNQTETISETTKNGDDNVKFGIIAGIVILVILFIISIIARVRSKKEKH